MVNNTDKLFRYIGLHLFLKDTIRQISEVTSIPYMTLNRLVKDFSQKGVLDMEKKGKSFLVSLNRSHPLAKQYLILSSAAFAQDFLAGQPLLQKVKDAVCQDEISLILFGSYASGNQKKHSDIDLSIISRKKVSTQELSFLEQLHDTEINTMLFTPSQFKSMLVAREENVGKQILANHVVLHNPEFFWNTVFRAIA